MAVIVFYLVVCTVRMTMPGLDPRDRNFIFGFRVSIAALGAAVSYIFLYAVYKAKGHFIWEPRNALNIGLLIFGLFAVTGEYLARKKLRSLNIFPPNKKIPWTY